MRRLPLIAGISAAVVAVATSAYASAGSAVPKGFRPETAAVVGARDLWIEGTYRCGGEWCLALVRSTDGGAHFVRVALPAFPSQGTDATLEFANVRDGFAYIATGPLFATHDGGQSWHRAGPTHVLTLTTAAGDAYVVTRRKGLERSPVARDTWRLSLPMKTSYPIGLAAHRSSVWLVGPPWRRSHGDTIRISANRGRTFTARIGPCLAGFDGRLVASAGGVVWAVCPSGMMASLSVSTNGGRSFAVRSFHDPGGVHQPSLTNGAQIAPASARVAVLDQGGGGALLRTTDAGRHWTRVAGTAGLDGVISLSFSTNRNGILLATTRAHPNRAALWRTTDAGATWQTVALP